LAPTEVREHQILGCSDLAGKAAFLLRACALLDTNLGVAEEAGKLMSKRDLPRMDRMESLMAESDASGREAIIYALGRSGEPAVATFLAHALSDSSALVRARAYEGLQSLGRSAAPQLMAVRRAFAGEDECREEAALAILALGGKDESALDVLRSALADSRPWRRWVNLERVATLGSAAGLLCDALADLLLDEEPADGISMGGDSNRSRVCWRAAAVMMDLRLDRECTSAIEERHAGATGKGRIATGLILVNIDPERRNGVSVLRDALTCRSERDAWAIWQALRLIRSLAEAGKAVDPSLIDAMSESVRSLCEVGVWGENVSSEAAEVLLACGSGGTGAYRAALAGGDGCVVELLVRALERCPNRVRDFKAQLEAIAGKPGSEAASIAARLLKAGKGHAKQHDIK